MTDWTLLLKTIGLRHGEPAPSLPHAANNTALDGRDEGQDASGLRATTALDADHISAIDNATRQLVSQGQLPITCGESSQLPPFAEQSAESGQRPLVLARSLNHRDRRQCCHSCQVRPTVLWWRESC